MAWKKLTFQEATREVDTHVAVPLPAPPGHRRRYRGDVDLLQLLEDPVPGPEPDDDLGHAEEEGLDPELEQLALEVLPVPVVADVNGGLELDPVDGVASLGRFGVPDCWVVASIASAARIDM